MASRSLGTLTVDLIAKVGGFAKGMDRAEREADKRAKAIERRLKKMGDGIEKGLAAAAAVAIAGLGALTVGIKKAIDAADDLSKLSQRTGVSVEALSRLEVAASQSDTSLESLQKGIVNLGRAQLEARKGTEEQVALFKALGIGIQELEDMSPDVLLKRIADAFQATADSPEKAAVAMKLFGRAGAELIPLLNGGSEELERFERLSDELGNTISTETAQAAADFNDQLDLVKIGLGGVWRTAAQDLLPTLNELAADFNDPRFREGFSKLVTGAVEATVAVAGLISEIGNVTNFVGEELAARINGPAADDIVRLEQRADRLREELDNIVIDVPALLSPYGIGKRAELAAQIAEVEQQIKEAREWEDRLAKQAQPEPTAETPEAAEPTSGIDFDAWRKAVQEREAASKAAAAARRAESVATREQAEIERKAAEALRESEAAMASYITTTENLRAELGGPLAQAQLDYIRREDELIRLAKLAGLTQEELASSLDLLEQARKRDVDAIEEQIKAEQALKKAQEDAPLIQQMDRLRDTTAGFFADLVKNGKDAIDRLEDYLLDLALEGIGRQIAEGLFGDFGTTGTGSKGNWLSSIFGSLFGGPRAEGGPVYPGKAYLVGEEGPELIRPMGAGMVVPAGETARMGRGITVGGDTINILGATSNRALQHLEISKARRMRKFEREFS